MSGGRGLAHWLWRYMSERIFLLVALAVLVLLAAYAASLPPVFVRYAIDRGISAGSLSAVLLYSSLVVAFAAASGVMNFLARYVSARYAQEITHRIRLEAFEAVLRKYLGFFDRSSVGQLISRITNDSERVAGFLSDRLRMIFSAAGLLAFAAYNMLGLQPQLTAIAVASMLLVVAVYARYASIIRPLYDSIRQQLGVVASLTTNNLVGIKTVKGLNILGSEVARFGRENERFAEMNVRAARIRALYGNSTVLVFGISSALVILYGAYAIGRGELTVGGLVMFLTYLATLSRPLNMLGFSIAEIQRALASARRLYELVGSEEAVREDPRALTLERVEGSLKFANVSFTYPSGGRRALKGVSLEVRSGEKVLVVGPPGSGKSTLLKLVMRFYEPEEGAVLLDGVDVRRIRLSSLRRHVGYVPQEPFVFNGTLYDNIALGNASATPEEVARAAEVAKIREFIESLPKGFDTPVGERGVNLSGGQRQRIAIARALVRNPRVLLLDDPVANLDASTEKALLEDLREILKDRTAIIVSQRLSLVPLVDRIVVMNDGEIVEEGTHEELMERRGLYYRLYTSMVGGDVGAGN